MVGKHLIRMDSTPVENGSRSQQQGTIECIRQINTANDHFPFFALCIVFPYRNTRYRAQESNRPQRIDIVYFFVQLRDVFAACRAFRQRRCISETGFYDECNI